MNLLKPLNTQQKITAVFVLSLIIISFPNLLFLTRKTSCSLFQPKGNNLCSVLNGKNIGPGIGKPEIEIFGYYLTVRPRGSPDFSDTTYSLLTGEVVRECGFWIGFSMQNGSPCATPEELVSSKETR